MNAPPPTPWPESNPNKANPVFFLPPGFKPERKRLELPPGVQVPGYERRDDDE